MFHSQGRASGRFYPTYSWVRGVSNAEDAPLISLGLTREFGERSSVLIVSVRVKSVSSLYPAFAVDSSLDSKSRVIALAGVLAPRGKRLATADAEAWTSRTAEDPTQGVLGGWFRVRSTASGFDGFSCNEDGSPPSPEEISEGWEAFCSREAKIFSIFAKRQ